MYNRKLLAKLSRCAWKVLGTYLKQSVPFDDAVAGAAIAVHTFGEFQQFNPHLHLIVLAKHPIALVLFELVFEKLAWSSGRLSPHG
jgi:hypothetical protein